MSEIVKNQKIKHCDIGFGIPTLVLRRLKGNFRILSVEQDLKITNERLYDI